MYNLRSMAKEKLRKNIKEMKEMVQPKDMKHSSLSSEIELT